MKRQNGGYLIIDLSSATLLADLEKAYANGKPVLVYEDDKATWCVIKESEGAYTLINPDTTYSISSEGEVTKTATIPSYSEPNLFRHDVVVTTSKARLTITLYNKTGVALTYNTLINALSETSLSETSICCSGVCTATDSTGIIIGIVGITNSGSTKVITVKVAKSDYTTANHAITEASYFLDVVTQVLGGE